MVKTRRDQSLKPPKHQRLRNEALRPAKFLRLDFTHIRTCFPDNGPPSGAARSVKTDSCRHPTFRGACGRAIASALVAENRALVMASLSSTVYPNRLPAQS